MEISNQEEKLNQSVTFDKSVKREFNSNYVSFFTANSFIMYLITLVWFSGPYFLTFDPKQFSQIIFSMSTTLLMNTFTLVLWPLFDIYMFINPSPSLVYLYIGFFLVRMLITYRYHLEINAFSFKLIRKYIVHQEQQ